MKKLLLLFFLLQVVPQSLEAQSIRIMDQYIVPFNPKSGDSVFVQLRTRFSSSYGSFGYEVERIGDSFSISQCVYLGPLTVVMTHDTLLFLDMLDTGEYDVNYTVNPSNTPDSCTYVNPVDSTVHFQIGLATGVKSEQDLRFQIYPNPSSGIVHVAYPPESSEPIQFSVYSMDGKQVFSSVFTANLEGHSEIDLSLLAKGMYVLMLQSGSGTRRVRVLMD